MPPFCWQLSCQSPLAEHRLPLLTVALRQRPAHRHAVLNPSEPCLFQMWRRGSLSESSPAVFLLLSEHHQPKPAWKCCEAAAELNLQSAQHSSVCCHAPGEPFWDQPCFSTSCHCNCFYPLCVFYRQSKRLVLQWGSASWSSGAAFLHASHRKQAIKAGKDPAAWCRAGNEGNPVTRFQWLRKGWAITPVWLCATCRQRGKSTSLLTEPNHTAQPPVPQSMSHKTPQVMQLSFFKH